MPKTYLIIFISGLVLASCSQFDPIKERDRMIYRDSNYNFFGDGRSPDLQEFNSTIRDAIVGDNQALTRLLSWASLAQGAESEYYSKFLLKIQKIVGQTRFVQAYEALSEEDQGTVKSLLLRTSRS